MDERYLAKGTRCAGSARPKNERTRVACAGGVFDRDPLMGVLALAWYESALRKAARTHPPESVYVATLDSDGSAVNDCVLAPGESVAFGRHEQAQLQQSSSDVSLRHVTIAVAPSSTAKAPLVRVWDLATNRPFRTEDGLITEALTADGPVFLSVGSVCMVAIPLSCLPTPMPMGTIALWKALPQRDVISRVAVGSTVRPIPDMQAVHRNEVTRVTRVSAAAPLHDCEPSLAVGSLTFSSQEGRRKFHISAEALERGILIGRYDRCLPLAENSGRISRVHLLLSKVGPDVVAMDTASTHGTLMTGNRSTFLVLAAKADLLLADELALRWQAFDIAQA